MKKKPRLVIGVMRKTLFVPFSQPFSKYYCSSLKSFIFINYSLINLYFSKLASDLFQKDFEQIRGLFIFEHQKSWDSSLNWLFGKQYLCGQVEITKWIICSRKIGVKCVYLSFIFYKFDLTWRARKATTIAVAILLLILLRAITM